MCQLILIIYYLIIIFMLNVWLETLVDCSVYPCSCLFSVNCHFCTVCLPSAFASLLYLLVNLTTRCRQWFGSWLNRSHTSDRRRCGTCCVPRGRQGEEVDCCITSSLSRLPSFRLRRTVSSQKRPHRYSIPTSSNFHSIIVASLQVVDCWVTPSVPLRIREQQINPIITDSVHY